MHKHLGNPIANHHVHDKYNRLTTVDYSIRQRKDQNSKSLKTMSQSHNSMGLVNGLYQTIEL